MDNNLLTHNREKSFDAGNALHIGSFFFLAISFPGSMGTRLCKIIELSSHLKSFFKLTAILNEKNGEISEKTPSKRSVAFQNRTVYTCIPRDRPSSSNFEVIIKVKV